MDARDPAKTLKGRGGGMGGWRPLSVIERQHQRPVTGHPVEQRRQPGADGPRVKLAIARLSPQQRYLHGPPLAPACSYAMCSYPPRARIRLRLLHGPDSKSS
jgi:hypothetical protein